MTEKEITEEVVEEGVHNYSAADAYVWRRSGRSWSGSRIRSWH